MTQQPSAEQLGSICKGTGLQRIYSRFVYWNIFSSLERVFLTKPDDNLSMLQRQPAFLQDWLLSSFTTRDSAGVAAQQLLLKACQLKPKCHQNAAHSIF